MMSSTSRSCPRASRKEVLRQAQVRNALLITSDTDFGDLAFRKRLVHSGVILLRLSGLSNAAKAAAVAEVFRNRAAEVLGAFSVISPDHLRIRRNF